jgi:RNA polymerase sigma-70 factor (ECF subfamily)
MSRPLRAETYQEGETTVDLLRRTQQGDDEALSRLYHRYLPRLRRWAHRRLPPGARGMLETADLVQSTFAHILENIDSFQPQWAGAFHAYVRRALKNRIADEIRRAARRPAPEALEGSGPMDAAPSPLEQAIGRENLERYEGAFQRLDPVDQQAILLRIEMGFSYAEVAKELGKPSPDAARMAVKRALVRLSEEMK